MLFYRKTAKIDKHEIEDNAIQNKHISDNKILGKKFQCNSYKVSDLIKDKELYGREYKQCIGSQFQPCIGADGEVYVCTNHRGHKDRSYGSLYEKSFFETTFVSSLDRLDKETPMDSTFLPNFWKE